MKKLNLKKKVISSLSEAEMTKIQGGLEQAGTTSFNVCSKGFICCGSTANPGCGGTGGSFVITGCPTPPKEETIG